MGKTLKKIGDFLSRCRSCRLVNKHCFSYFGAIIMGIAGIGFLIAAFVPMKDATCMDDTNSLDSDAP